MFGLILHNFENFQESTRQSVQKRVEEQKTHSYLNQIQARQRVNRQYCKWWKINKNTYSLRKQKLLQIHKDMPLGQILRPSQRQMSISCLMIYSQVDVGQIQQLSAKIISRACTKNNNYVTRQLSSLILLTNQLYLNNNTYANLKQTTNASTPSFFQYKNLIIHNKYNFFKKAQQIIAKFKQRLFGQQQSELCSPLSLLQKMPLNLSKITPLNIKIRRSSQQKKNRNKNSTYAIKIYM
eukprot:TRINITY_DN1491_c0_g1_i5.p2 TRINITY_DN1491_c0_g1~~TRINITY_DN1491_c0_g1_i5.p2  ORF type:complete len:238 (-),score=-7.62 TRINITY_DN1491_c0_g1_i5:1068-1781(-)